VLSQPLDLYIRIPHCGSTRPVFSFLSCFAAWLAMRLPHPRSVDRRVSALTIKWPSALHELFPHGFCGFASMLHLLSIGTPIFDVCVRRSMTVYSEGLVINTKCLCLSLSGLRWIWDR